MELIPGMVVADRFRLARKLGEGGMGAVWSAHHEKLDTPCAVKFIHPEVLTTPGVRARFEREAKIAAQLRSPHVVQVLDYGIWEGAPYIAMEYLEGEDLAHRLQRLGRLSPRETVAIVGQIARALTKAHAAGLVHRDLKPENVFIVRDDDAELVKVLDFGIAKSQAPTLDHMTRTGAILGTPHYMSPEQAQGTKTLDHRADLWSLAVISYRSVVGALPFQSDALGDLLMRIIVHPLPVPSHVAADVPPPFDAWWLRAAARDPSQRFQTAKELAESLAAALGVSASLGAVSLPLPSSTPIAAAVAHTPPTPYGSAMGAATAMQGTPGPHAPSGPYGSGASQPGSVPSASAPQYAVPSAPAPLPTFGASLPAQGISVGVAADRTMSPASHTYVDTPPAGGTSALPKIVAAVAALVAGAAIAIGAVKLTSHRNGESAPASAETQVAAPPAPPTAATATPVTPVTPDPAGAPPVTPAPSADATATAAPSGNIRNLLPPPHPVAHPKPTQPPPPPPPPTAPARTGRVVIPTPQP